MTHKGQSRWPAVRSAVHFSSSQVDDFEVRRESFCRDLGLLFDRLQSAFCRLGSDERARCGQDQVAVEISLQIDIKRREVLLDKIFKYCDLNFHIFTELLKILQRHFSDCNLMVPTLQGDGPGP